MAEYRQIHTHIWKDSWFIELGATEKLLFIYLFSNERACLAGLYDLSAKVIAFETDLEIRLVETILLGFEEAGKIVREGSLIWIPNLMRYNAGNLTSPKIQAHLRTTLEGIPDCDLKHQWIRHYNGMVSGEYRIDTLSIPYLESESEQEQESDSEHDTEQEQEDTGADAPPDPPKRKPKTPTPEAVKVFRQNAHRYPAKSWYQRVDSIVGKDPPDLKFWGEIVHNWVGLGWNPTNVKGMLDCYQRRELPGNSRAGPTPPAIDRNAGLTPIDEEGALF